MLVALSTSTYLQSVEKCGFSGSVESKDQNAHLLWAKEALEIAHQPTHFVREIFPGLLRDKLEMSTRQGILCSPLVGPWCSLSLTNFQPVLIQTRSRGWNSGLNFQLWQQWFTGCRKKSEFWWQLPQNVHRPLSSVLVFSLTRKKKARVRGNATLSIELATLFWNRLNAKSWGLLNTQPFFGYKSDNSY